MTIDLTFDAAAMQVCIKRVNKQNLFAKKYPAAAQQVTTHREMEAGICRCCDGCESYR